MHMIMKHNILSKFVDVLASEKNALVIYNNYLTFVVTVKLLIGDNKIFVTIPF